MLDWTSLWQLLNLAILIGLIVLAVLLGKALWKYLRRPCSPHIGGQIPQEPQHC